MFSYFSLSQTCKSLSFGCCHKSNHKTKDEFNSFRNSLKHNKNNVKLEAVRVWFRQRNEESGISVKITFNIQNTGWKTGIRAPHRLTSNID